jgi:hypothetical protein
VGGVQAAEVCFVGDRRLRAFAIPFESVPPSVSRPLRSRRPWRSYPTAPVQPPSSRAGPPQPLALRAPAGPLCCPGHAGRAVGRGRGWGVFASGWGWGCAAGVVAQKYRCRVGWEVARPSPSPDPDKEISTIRLFR